MPKWLEKLITFISLKIVSKIHWNGLRALFNHGVYWDLTEEEHDYLREVLKPNYFIILTRRKTHLTTYFISLANWIKTGKFGYYSHSLLNIDDGNVDDDNAFVLMEAIGKGVTKSSFMKVFDCDSVALLKPKGVTHDEWVAVIDKTALEQFGKPYDTLFNIKDDSAVSCVEFVRVCLKTLPDYETRFANFEAIIQKYKNLTPDMFYNCCDFEIFYETRH